jgi:hypothetical protein
MEEHEELKISKFSGGVNIQIRLNSLWIDSHNHSRSGLFSKWNCDLDRIWIELSGDLKESEYEQYKKSFDEHDSKICKTGCFDDDLIDEFKTITKESIKKRNEQYKILMEKELFLKRVEKHLGKGTSWDDEDKDDF